MATQRLAVRVGGWLLSLAGASVALGQPASAPERGERPIGRGADQLFYEGRSLDAWVKQLSLSFIHDDIDGRPIPEEPLAAIRALGVDAVPALIDALDDINPWCAKPPRPA